MNVLKEKDLKLNENALQNDEILNVISGRFTNRILYRVLNNLDSTFQNQEVEFQQQ